MKTEDKYFIFDNEKKFSVRSCVFGVMNVFRTALYRSVLMLNRHKDRNDRKYNVSICAIFKNESPYLKEWIEYHRLVGADHIYLYNNNSDDSYRSVVSPYVDRGWVTLIDWPHDQKQMEAYIDCIKNYSHETKWLGFIDIDEFVVPKSTDSIPDFLSAYEDRGSVLIYWKLFGTSGHIDRDITRCVTEDFTVCWPKYCDIGKCFYNTSFGFRDDSPRSKMLHHKLWTVSHGVEIPPVNVFDHLCFGGLNKADSRDFPIQINHYFTKSYGEYETKRAKGDVYFKINPHDLDYFYEHEMKCSDIDYSAYKYLIKLKKQMEEQ